MDFNLAFQEAVKLTSKKWVDGWDEAGFSSIMVVISATMFISFSMSLSLTFMWWASYLLGGFVLTITTLRTKSWRRVEAGKLDDRTSASLGLSLCFLIMALLGSAIGEIAFASSMPLFWASYFLVFFVTVLMAVRYASPTAGIALSRVFVFHTIFLLGAFVLVTGLIAYADQSPTADLFRNKLVGLATLFGILSALGISRVIGFMRRRWKARKQNGIPKSDQVSPVD